MLRNLSTLLNATSFQESCIIVLQAGNDVAVSGILDPEFGESLAAHVELAVGTNLSVEGIRAHVATQCSTDEVA